MADGSDVELTDGTVPDLHAGPSRQPQQYHPQVEDHEIFHARSVGEHMQHVAPAAYDAPGNSSPMVVDVDEERNDMAGSSSSSHAVDAQPAFMWSSQANFENTAINDFVATDYWLFPEALDSAPLVDQETYGTGVAMKFPGEGLPVEPRNNGYAQQPWVGNDVPDNLLSRGYDTFHIGGPQHISSQNPPQWAFRLPTKARIQPSQDHTLPASTYGQPCNVDHAGPSHATNGFVNSIPAVWKDVDDELSRTVRAENNPYPNPQTNLDPAELHALMGFPPEFVLRGEQPDVALQGDNCTVYHPGYPQ